MVLRRPNRGQMRAIPFCSEVDLTSARKGLPNSEMNCFAKWGIRAESERVLFAPYTYLMPPTWHGKMIRYVSCLGLYGRLDVYSQRARSD